MDLVSLRVRVEVMGSAEVVEGVVEAVVEGVDGTEGGIGSVSCSDL